MSVLNFAQIEQLWTAAGGDPGWAPLAAGIAMAESGGNTTALNNNPSTGDYSVGLWQINYYNGLLGPRTQAYGSPQNLQASPQAQAKAAVALSGNGTNWGPWRTDRAWNAWVAAGSPSQPSAATVQGWLGKAGVPTGGGPPGTIPQSPTTTNPSTTTGQQSGLSQCYVGINVPSAGSAIVSVLTLGLAGGGGTSQICFLTKGNVKWFSGAAAILAGTAVGMFGVVILAAIGFDRSGAKQAVNKVGKTVGIGGALLAGQPEVAAGIEATSKAGGAKKAAPSRRAAPSTSEPRTAGRRESRDIERQLEETQRQQGPIGPRGGNPTARRVAYEQRRGTSSPGGGRPRTPEQVRRARERASQPF